MVEPRLDVTNGLVPKVTSQATRKTRQAFHTRSLELREVGLDELKWVALEREVRCAGHLETNVSVTRLDAGAGRQANEGVAAKALTPHHRLEQKTVRCGREFQVGRQRRVEIGLQASHKRNAVVARTCEGHELLKINGLDQGLLKNG